MQEKMVVFHGPQFEGKVNMMKTSSGNFILQF